MASISRKTERLDDAEPGADRRRIILQHRNWSLDKIQKGIAAADRNDFVSDEEVARVRAKFTVR